MYQGTIQIKDEFIVVNTDRMGEFPVGAVLEVTGFDCDQWPYVIERKTGRTECIPTGRFRDCVEKYNCPLRGNWIVWDLEGSTLCSSEEEAKATAESWINSYMTRNGGPVYIAEAQNMVRREAMVWTRD